MYRVVIEKDLIRAGYYSFKIRLQYRFQDQSKDFNKGLSKRDLNYRGQIDTELGVESIRGYRIIIISLENYQLIGKG